MIDVSSSEKYIIEAYKIRQEQNLNFNVARLLARKVQRAACKKQFFKGNYNNLSVEANSDSIMLKM